MHSNSITFETLLNVLYTYVLIPNAYRRVWMRSLISIFFYYFPLFCTYFAHYSLFSLYFAHYSLFSIHFSHNVLVCISFTHYSLTLYILLILLYILFILLIIHYPICFASQYSLFSICGFPVFIILYFFSLFLSFLYFLVLYVFIQKFLFIILLFINSIHTLIHAQCTGNAIDLYYLPYYTILPL